MQELKDNIALTELMKKVSYGDRAIMKWQIIKECNITPIIFYNWRYGRTPIPPLAKEKIEQIAGKQIFSRETNEAL